MKYVINSVILFGIILSSIFLYAQGIPPVVHVDQISQSISMKDLSVSLGTRLIVDMKVTNISTSAWVGPLEGFPHVEGEKGELPKTYYHRQLRHEPGLPDLDWFLGGAGTAFDKPKPVKPGESFGAKLDLTTYYVFSKPGKYTVYIETNDKFGKTIRTNTVTFEIKALAQ